MKTDNATRQTWREVVVYALAYALWVLTMMMAVLAVLQIRVAANALWVIGGGDRYSAALVDQVCLLLIGFVAFVYVIWLEHYYRDGVTLRTNPKLGDKIPPLPKARVMRELAERGLDVLLRRFAITFAIPLSFFLLSLAAYEATLDAMTPVR